MMTKTKISCMLALVGLLLLNMPVHAQSLKVMTFNLRYNNPDDGDNSWEFRKDAVSRIFLKVHPSLFGCQEGLNDQLRFLQDYLKSYAYIGVGRDDGKTKGEYCAIFYDTTRTRMIRNATFWLSSRPDSISVGWDASTRRICTWGLFEEISSGKQFYVFNTHLDHVGKTARRRSAQLLLQKIAELNVKGLPVVLMGDFNASAESKPVKIISGKLSEASAISKTPLSGPSGTFNNFRPEQRDGECIDFVFVSGFTVDSCRHMDDKRPDGRTLSDHFPVWVSLSHTSCAGSPSANTSEDRRTHRRMLKRNSYMLTGHKARKGYDWWWHDITAVNDATGQPERFFIEYFVMNPALSPETVVYGQTGQPGKVRPSYAKIMAGKWGEDKSQLHAYYPSGQFQVHGKGFNVTIGENVGSESLLKGAVSLTREEVAQHPERMSDAGEMSWDLKISDKVTYSVGYGTSGFFRKLNLFRMFWHVQGLRTCYDGKIWYNGQSYTVSPETYIGYQDKNWGTDYTNPWIWLNCNNFYDRQGQRVENISVDVGGGKPVVMGIPLSGRILVAFYENGKIHDFNFTRLFHQKQQWNCSSDEHFVYWNVVVENKKNILELQFKCEKQSMLKINYENPKGAKNHKDLWNGGYATGNLKFYLKLHKEKILLYDLNGKLGGCEYGRYEK